MSCCNRPLTYLVSNCCPPSNMQHRVTSTSACLNFFKCNRLPSFPPSPGQLKWQVSCYMPAIAKCRLVQVTEQLGSASGHPIQFFSCRERPSSGEWLQSVHCRRNTTPPPPQTSAVRLCHSTVWNTGEMTLEINLYELTVLCECYVLEMERMETWGNSWRFWNRKCIKWVKKLFHHQICYFLGGKFSYARMY
jgi:hypothetical protein